MSKCNFCEYPKIDTIMFCGCAVDVCNKCDFIKIPLIKLHEIIVNYAKYNNFFNLKKCINVEDIDEKDAKKFLAYIKYLDILNFKLKRQSTNILCNFCKDELIEIQNKRSSKIKLFYCEYCNSIYVDPKEFTEYLHIIKDLVEKEAKWYGFIFKIF